MGSAKRRGGILVDREWEWCYAIAKGGVVRVVLGYHGGSVIAFSKYMNMSNFVPGSMVQSPEFFFICSCSITPSYMYRYW